MQKILIALHFKVTLHYEETESEVKVETMNDEPERIKCFPLYTILLALNQTQVDLLSLGCQGQELEILQTSKFIFAHCANARAFLCKTFC
jgi:hypothetical protein